MEVRSSSSARFKSIHIEPPSRTTPFDWTSARGTEMGAGGWGWIKANNIKAMSTSPLSRIKLRISIPSHSMLTRRSLPDQP